MSQILERIKKAYQLETDAEVADFLGIKPSTLSMQKNRGKLNLELIIDKCREINQNWLLYGEGPMKRLGSSGLTIPVYGSLKLSEEGDLQLDESTQIGRLQVEGELLEQNEKYCHSARVLGYRLIGDTHDPTLNENDIAIANIQHTEPGEGMYLLFEGTDIVCRRIKEEDGEYRLEGGASASGGKVNCSSGDDFRILGKLITLVRHT